VTTYRTGYPSELKHRLERVLPGQDRTLVVRVTPRDRAHRKCAAWSADHYEVQAYYAVTSHDALDVLEKALGEVPGVYLTTQVRTLAGRLRNTVTNPGWPAALGTSRRGLHELRPQVLALIAD
jgi:hypothetical protein